MASKRSDSVFASTPVSGVSSNRFDLSHDVKMSFRMGRLYPVTCLEVLPGDVWNIDFVTMLRFMPLISPVMHRLKVTTDYFFVPNRLMWTGWEDWITGVTGGLPPLVVLDEHTIGETSLGNYLGLPVGNYGDTVAELSVSAFPAAAYLKLYDDWYRDQNQISETFVPLVAGNNSGYATTLTSVCKSRAWEHDYFTSALPTAQQGTDVEIPLTFQNDIPVEWTNSSVATPLWRKPSDGTVSPDGFVKQVVGQSFIDTNTLANRTGYDPDGTLTVDIQSDAASINDLRRAWSLQSFLEKSIRGGIRYVEQIWSHFQVRSSDARLQRAEFIGRSVQNVTVSEVLATAQSSNDNTNAQIAVGNMAGHALSVGGGNNMSFRAEEHGWIIGIISVLPDTAYMDGLHRSWSRFDRFDYAWPEFAGIGEQAIKNKELMCHDVADAADLEVDWGYVPRFSEYRFFNSRVAGQMATSLDFWHMGRKFAAGSIPGLNADFIEADPTKRIFAVTGNAEDELVAHIMNKISVVRKLPRYGIPSTIG